MNEQIIQNFFNISKKNISFQQRSGAQDITFQKKNDLSLLHLLGRKKKKKKVKSEEKKRKRERIYIQIYTSSKKEAHPGKEKNKIKKTVYKVFKYKLSLSETQYQSFPPTIVGN